MRHGRRTVPRGADTEACPAQQSPTGHRRQFQPDRPSLIRSLIQLRSETFGAHQTGQAGEVTDPIEPRRTQAHRLGKRVVSKEGRAAPLTIPQYRQLSELSYALGAPPDRRLHALIASDAA